MSQTPTYRILIAEDEPEIRQSYQKILCPETITTPSLNQTLSMAAALFSNFEESAQPHYQLPQFDITLCSQGDQAIQAAKQAITENRPYSVAFLDMRMPPGPDGVQTAHDIRQIDPNIELVMVTAFSDVHPARIADRIGPVNKLLYIQKPFSPLEITQCAISLCTKWQTELHLLRSYADVEEKVRQRTAELAAANEELQRIEKLKSELAITISHELRTPLTIFRNLLSNLKAGVMGPVTEKQIEAIDTADKEIKRLARILRDFMDITSLESGQIDFDIRPISIYKVIEYAIKILTPILKLKNVTYKLEMPTQDTVIMADPDRTVQVLDKLIDNAIRYGNPDNPSIILKVSDLNDCIRIDVQDNGKGIPNDDVSRLFNRFVQIERQVGAGYHGTGLGLPICKKLIEKQKGQIWVENSPLGGACFSFTLPKIWTIDFAPHFSDLMANKT